MHHNPQTRGLKRIKCLTSYTLISWRAYYDYDKHPKLRFLNGRDQSVFLFCYIRWLSIIVFVVRDISKILILEGCYHVLVKYLLWSKFTRVLLLDLVVPEIGNMFREVLYRANFSIPKASRNIFSLKKKDKTGFILF